MPWRCRLKLTPKLIAGCQCSMLFLIESEKNLVATPSHSVVSRKGPLPNSGYCVLEIEIGMNGDDASGRAEIGCSVAVTTFPPCTMGPGITF